jgi:hypothetical protein
MAGQKREARLRARCPGHPRLEDRHCEERKRRSNPDTSTKDWIASLTLAMTSPSDMTSPSHGARAPGFCKNSCSLLNRGRRECRAPMHPQPRVQSKKAHELVTTGSPVHTGIPCAMVLTAYSALSLVNRALLSPSPVRCASIVTRLTPASGRRDHTASPSAKSRARHARGSASTAPCPAFVAIASRPSWWDRMAQVRKGDLPVGARRKIWSMFSCRRNIQFGPERSDDLCS